MLKKNDDAWLVTKLSNIKPLGINFTAPENGVIASMHVEMPQRCSIRLHAFKN